MQLKNRWLPIAGIAVVFATAFDILSDNGKAGYTASPGEILCDDCHSSFGNSNAGSGTIYLTSSMNNWQYVPGQTYTMSVVVKHTGRPLFGFGCEALTSSNTNAGTIVVTNTAKTQLKSKSVSGVLRNNIVHQMNGGLANDSAVFTFNWQAPATNVGNVTFYFSGVAANNNGDDNGDYVYNSTKLVTPASTTGLTENHADHSHLQSHINQNGDITLKYVSEASVAPRVDLYDLNGRLIVSRNFELQGSGNVELVFDRPLGLREGIYVISLLSGSTVSSNKIHIY